MLRLSDRQFAKLNRRVPDHTLTVKRKRPAKPRKAKLPSLTEADIVRQVRDFLEAHNWRLVRTGSGLPNVNGRRYRHGETGGADQLWLRYEPVPYLFWIETKREKGGELSPAQIRWQELERLRGATVLNVGHSTNAECLSFLQFQIWYSATFPKGVKC